MTITVKIAEAETRLAELLKKVEAGEEVIIARGEEPIARLIKVQPKEDIKSLIQEIKETRAGRPHTTIDEILAWRHEGHRY